GDEVELLQLGQALDQLAHLRAEQLVDLLARGGGVLDRVVQQRHRYRGLVEVHVSEDRGDLQRMREVRIAGGAALMAMLLHGVDIGLVEQRLVDVRLVALTALDKLVLTHHCTMTQAQKQSSADPKQPALEIDSHETPAAEGRESDAISSRRSFRGNQPLDAG